SPWEHGIGLGLLRTWNATTGRRLRVEPFAREATAAQELLLSPDASTAAVSTSDGFVELWDLVALRAGRKLATYPNSLTFSPDGKRIVAGGRDNTLQVWDGSSGQLRATLWLLPDEATGTVEWLAFTPEGYFDGSPGIRRHLRWRTGSLLHPAEMYERLYHNPEAVRKALQ